MFKCYKEFVKLSVLLAWTQNVGVILWTPWTKGGACNPIPVIYAVLHPNPNPNPNPTPQHPKPNLPLLIYCRDVLPRTHRPWRQRTWTALAGDRWTVSGHRVLRAIQIPLRHWLQDLVTVLLSQYVVPEWCNWRLGSFTVVVAKVVTGDRWGSVYYGRRHKEDSQYKEHQRIVLQWNIPKLAALYYDFHYYKKATNKIHFVSRIEWQVTHLLWYFFSKWTNDIITCDIRYRQHTHTKGQWKGGNGKICIIKISISRSSFIQ